MMIAVVKYNAGNVHSVRTALDRLGATYTVTDNEREILSADHVIFPGVGEASSAMRYLRERELDQVLRRVTAPLLGLCLGQQLLCARSEENDATCLEIVPTVVRRFTVPRKVPHMGWSRVFHDGHPVFAEIEQGAYFYFVHSFRLDLDACTIARCTYEEEFSAAIARDNFVGVQFHPEKSGRNGELLLSNFIRWRV